MSRRKTENSISMFPFLAVLVCTMGALILLLLVTTRRIRDEHEGSSNQTIAATDAEPPTTKDQPEPESVPETAFVIESAGDADGPREFESHLLPPPSQEELKNQLQSAEQRIAEIQNQITADVRNRDKLNKSIEELRGMLLQREKEHRLHQTGLKKLEELNARKEELAGLLEKRQETLDRLKTDLEKQSQLTEDSESVLRNRESALVSLRALAKEQERAESDLGDKTVIEFSNPDGTSRAPIFVDVNERGYRFLPSNVEIKWDDMSGFPSSDNPLLAGVLAIHDTRHPNSISVKPYVLLLVRPTGSMPFYAAQRTLTNAGIHFGYELLDAERKIAAGTASLAEQNAVQKSLLSALERRRKLYGGLMAQVESLRESARQRQQTERRRAIVLPNGSIASAEEGSEFGGRFYAGGHPPPKVNDPVAVPQRRQAPSFADRRAIPEPRSANQATKADGAFPDIFSNDSESTVGNVQPLITNHEPRSSTGAPAADSPQRTLDSARNKSEFGFNNSLESTDISPAVEAQNLSEATSNRTDSQRSSGWPETLPASESPATRTAGTAEQSISPQRGGSPAVVGNATSAVGSPGDAAFGPPPGSTTQSWLDRFLQSVESEKQDAQPNPYLLAILQKSQRNDQMQKTNPLPPTNESRKAITVHMIDRRLFVAGSEIVLTSWQDEDRIYAAILDGLNKSFNGAAKASAETTWPAVRFVVSPDRLPVQSRISRRLAQRNVTTLAVRTVSPRKPEASQKLPDIEADQRREPAEPVPPSLNSGRRGI